MGLTQEQRELWNHLRPAVRPSPGQTEEQARNFAVLSFQNACSFEGIEVPSDDDVHAALEAEEFDEADRFMDMRDRLDREVPFTGVEPEADAPPVAQARVEEAAGQDFAEFGRQGGEVPVERWIPHPVSDSADYLDGPVPVYDDDETRTEHEDARRGDVAELTADQRELWAELALPVPKDEEGRKALIASFAYACEFQGLGEPDPEAVAAVIEEREERDESDDFLDMMDQLDRQRPYTGGDGG